MHSIIVKIEWDFPNDPGDENWLNADNVAIALHAYCKNTRFVVSSVKESIREALAESGVPSENYLAPVANVVAILQELLE